jgi:hypothetical protein
MQAVARVASAASRFIGSATASIPETAERSVHSFLRWAAVPGREEKGIAKASVADAFGSAALFAEDWNMARIRLDLVRAAQD